MKELLLLDLERFMLRKKEIELVQKSIITMKDTRTQEASYIDLITRFNEANTEIEILESKFLALDTETLLSLFGALLRKDIYYYSEDGSRYISSLLNIKENEQETERGSR